jgi:hypothetical protein
MVTPGLRTAAAVNVAELEVARLGPIYAQIENMGLVGPVHGELEEQWHLWEHRLRDERAIDLARQKQSVRFAVGHVARTTFAAGDGRMRLVHVPSSR